ncbi:MAG: amino acid transport protein [Polyangiaceae bacterium]|jgi:hypothetical protein|nr:amino acid transport protein [Polyangiaceae bacterium]
MDLDANSLLASLGASSVGFVAFMYGKKQTRAPHMIVGLILMIFPYFVGNPLIIGGISLVLIGLLWGATRLGW